MVLRRREHGVVDPDSFECAFSAMGSRFGPSSQASRLDLLVLTLGVIGWGVAFFVQNRSWLDPMLVRFFQQPSIILLCWVTICATDFTHWRRLRRVGMENTEPETRDATA
jgi:hypothetical protein